MVENRLCEDICSRSLQGTQVKETGRYLQARDLSAFLNRGQIFAKDHSLGITTPWDLENH